MFCHLIAAISEPRQPNGLERLTRASSRAALRSRWIGLAMAAIKIKRGGIGSLGTTATGEQHGSANHQYKELMTAIRRLAESRVDLSQVQVMAETTTARALTDSEMMDDNSSERLSRLLLLFRDCCFACKKRKAAPPDGKTA